MWVFLSSASSFRAEELHWRTLTVDHWQDRAERTMSLFFFVNLVINMTQHLFLHRWPAVTGDPIDVFSELIWPSGGGTPQPFGRRAIFHGPADTEHKILANLFMKGFKLPQGFNKNHPVISSSWSCFRSRTAASWRFYLDWTGFRVILLIHANEKIKENLDFDPVEHINKNLKWS